MHLLHFGTYLQILYPYVKRGLMANTGIRNEADFTFELLGMIEKEAVYDMSASAASRYKYGKRALPEAVSASFRKDGIREIVIKEMENKYVTRIGPGRKHQLIREFVNVIGQDTTIDEEFKVNLKEEAVPERLAHFLSDILIYSVGIDPTEQNKSYPVENYNLPMSNDWFMGRTTELETLTNNFADGCRIQILYGMGGMGKSQLARKYAYMHYRSYSLLHWINANSIDSIIDCYRAFLSEKNLLPGEQSKKGICQRYTQYMDSHSDWLLVYDNCDYYTAKEYDDFSNLCLPKNRSVGNILITSRNKRPIGKAKRVRVDPLSIEDAISFLMQRTESEDASGAEQLAMRLSGFGLALEIAGAYISATPGCDFHTYLSYLDEETKILDRMVEVTDYTETIRDLLLLTIKRIRADRNNDSISLCVEDVLHLCAYGAPYYIDLGIFALLDTDEPGLNTASEADNSRQRLDAAKNMCADTLQCNELKQVLTTYGLAVEQSDGFLSMHELQLEILRDYIYPQSDWSYYAESALRYFQKLSDLTPLFYLRHEMYFLQFWEKQMRKRGDSEEEIANFTLMRRSTQISLLAYEYMEIDTKTDIDRLMERERIIRQSIHEATRFYTDMEEKKFDVLNLQIVMRGLYDALAFFRANCLYLSATITVYYVLHVLNCEFIRWGEECVVTEVVNDANPDRAHEIFGKTLDVIRSCFLLAIGAGEKSPVYLKIYLRQSIEFIKICTEKMHWEEIRLTDYLTIIEAYIAGDQAMLSESVKNETESDPAILDYMKKIGEYYRVDPSVTHDVPIENLVAGMKAHGEKGEAALRHLGFL